MRGLRHAPAALYPGKDPVPIVQEAGWVPGPVWTVAEKLASTGIRSPDRSARIHSVYRLSYRAHTGSIGCPKTLVRNYNYSLRNDPEERSSLLFDLFECLVSLVYFCVCMYVCMYVRMYVCMYVCIMYVRMYVCMCVLSLEIVKSKLCGWCCFLVFCLCVWLPMFLQPLQRC